eukprot:scaffold40191_cov60-Attheya_sp.AAC.7
MAVTNFDEDAKAMLEQIDKEMNDILLQAEEKIPVHLHIPWSPKLHNADLIWKYWKIRLSFILNNRTVSPRVLAFMKNITNNHKVRQGTRTLELKGNSDKHVSNSGNVVTMGHNIGKNSWKD